MGQDAGAAGAYGILLGTIGFPEMESINSRLEELITAYKDDEDGLELDEMDTSARAIAIQVELIALLKLNGIKVPDLAVLFYTGTEDARPARCDTPAESWVLGFGLFSKPNSIPRLDESFDKLSEWHTWVWQG